MFAPHLEGWKTIAAVPDLRSCLAASGDDEGGAAPPHQATALAVPSAAEQRSWMSDHDSAHGWFYLDADNIQQGPFSKYDLQAMTSVGQLTGKEMAWHHGMPGWLPLSAIAVLAALIAPQSGARQTTAAPAAGTIYLSFVSLTFYTLCFARPLYHYVQYIF